MCWTLGEGRGHSDEHDRRCARHLGTQVSEEGNANGININVAAQLGPGLREKGAGDVTGGSDARGESGKASLRKSS